MHPEYVTFFLLPLGWCVQSVRRRHFVDCRKTHPWYFRTRAVCIMLFFKFSDGFTWCCTSHDVVHNLKAAASAAEFQNLLEIRSLLFWFGALWFSWSLWFRNCSPGRVSYLQGFTSRVERCSCKTRLYTCRAGLLCVRLASMITGLGFIFVRLGSASYKCTFSSWVLALHIQTWVLYL